MRLLLSLPGVLLLLCLALNVVAAPANQPQQYESIPRHIVKIALDGKATEFPLWFVSAPDKKFYLRVIDLLAVDIRPPEKIGLTIDGYRFIPLDTLRSVQITLSPEVAHIWRGSKHPSVLEAPDVITDSPKHTTDTLQETWVDVDVNKSGDSQLVTALVDQNQHHYLNHATLEHFRLRTTTQPVIWAGEQFYAVDELPGVESTFNDYEQSLMLSANAEAFRPNRYDAGTFTYVKADFTQSGALLNYSLFGARSNGEDTFSSQLELAGFWGRGFFSTNQLLRDVTHDTRESVRLESSLRIDWPEQMRTLVVGDTQNVPGTWGRSVRFAGVRWGRNFSTQPQFVSFPTITANGSAELQSTVDIYVDNMRRTSNEVQPGPFTITNVPLVTGAGEVQIVTRDLLGRETSITRPFYSSSQLLKTGLHEYSYEIGSLRKSFGIVSNDYGDAFVSATHRYGVNHSLTGEIRAEFSEQFSTAGLAANFVWPALAEFKIASAASMNNDQQTGTRLELGVTRQARILSFGMSATSSSEHFSQLGDNHTLPNRLEARAFAATSFGDRGNISMSYINRDRRDEEDTEFVTLQYSFDLWKAVQVRLSYLEALSDDLPSSIMLSLSVPLGDRVSGHMSTRQRDGNTSSRLHLQRSLPAGNGIGYRLSAETGELEFVEAGVDLRGDKGQLSIRAAQFDEHREYRASADGGIAYLQSGKPLLSQRLDQAFAVIDIPETPNIGVYRDNQLVTTTQSDGSAVIPGLRAYQQNPIRIDDASLPMDIKISSLEKSVIPAYRHGVKLSLQVNKANWIGFTLVDSSGTPLNVGTQLTETGSEQNTVVGTSGKAFMELSPGPKHFSAVHRGGFCQFKLMIEPSQEVFPDLGIITCE